MSCQHEGVYDFILLDPSWLPHPDSFAPIRHHGFTERRELSVLFINWVPSSSEITGIDWNESKIKIFETVERLGGFVAKEIPGGKPDFFMGRCTFYCYQTLFEDIIQSFRLTE